MKKIIFSIFILFPFLLSAQLTFELKGIIKEKISHEFAEGKSVELSLMKQDASGYNKAKISDSEQWKFIDLKQLDRIEFKPTNLREFWQLQGVKSTVYENILKNGFQFELRKELENEALDYIYYLKQHNLLFEDSYIESYLYSLVYRMYPDRLNDGRPGILNVHILKDLSPNVFIFPNGSLFVSTGFLSTINSEEELISVLAHEVSHFILDHSIVNITKTIARQKRAEFWGALATGVAAVADMSMYNNDMYYTPGVLTLGTAVLASNIFEVVNERFGAKYSRDQEMEADRCAVELMKYVDLDPKALASALSKIKDYCIVTGNYLALTGEGTHPAIDDRINVIGNPSKFHDVDYDKRISLINTFNATLEFNNQHFEICRDLVQRNIEASVATEDDYLLLAMVTVFMYDNEEKNLEALRLIDIANEIGVTPRINQLKQKAIVLIRLKKYDEAKDCLIAYRETLDRNNSNLTEGNDRRGGGFPQGYLDKEYEWTQKMIHKVTNF